MCSSDLNFTDISVTDYYADVQFRVSRDGSVSVVTRDAADVTHTVRVEGNTLTVTRPEPSVGQRLFHHDDDDPEVTIYLPAGNYGALTVSNTSGDIETAGQLGFCVGQPDHRQRRHRPERACERQDRLQHHQRRSGRQPAERQELCGLFQHRPGQRAHVRPRGRSLHRDHHQRRHPSDRAAVTGRATLLKNAYEQSPGAHFRAF